MKYNSTRQINRRYNDQVKEAKELYKASRGLKIARGFGKTKDSKRIEYNRRRALRRFDKRKVDTVKIEEIFAGELFYSSISYSEIGRLFDIEFGFNERKESKRNFIVFVKNQVLKEDVELESFLALTTYLSEVYNRVGELIEKKQIDSFKIYVDLLKAKRRYTDFYYMKIYT